MSILNHFLFIAFPYAAIAVFCVGVTYRYKYASFKISSLSSQFLEGRSLFWGSVPFHFGIIIVFFGHLIAFLFPAEQLLWNSHPVRLLIYEATSLAFGFCVLMGLSVLFVRRLVNPRIRAVTNKMDIFLEILLLVQVVFGCSIALGYRWGSSWFASDLSPYLWSIVKLNPQIEAVSVMPWVIQAHIVGAFMIVFIFPFTRLVHILVAPFHYIIRPYQLVIWNRDRKTIRDPNTEWVPKRPKNT